MVQKRNDLLKKLQKCNPENLAGDGVKKVEKGPKNKRKPVSQAAAYGVLSAVMPKRQAALAAGYSPSTCTSVIDKRVATSGSADTIAAIRARVQDRPGFRFEDSAKFYRGISEYKQHQTADRIRARARLDTMLGYDSPQQVEVSERREIVAAVACIHSLTAQTGLSPRDLLRQVDQSPQMVEQAENQAIGQDGQGLK
jgi:hypothetical protein